MTPEELLRRIEILEEADNNLRAQIHSMAQVLAVNGITLDFRLADSVRAIEVAIGEMLRTAEGQSAAWADIRRRWFREG